MKRHLITLSLATSLALFGAVGGLGLTGCSYLPGHSNENASDRKLASEVKTALKRDPIFKYDQVQVSAANGTVQLSGFTQNEKAKQRAAELAKNINGVRDVINNIVVQS
jgi:osmotically-inducible protein OsmY